MQFTVAAVLALAATASATYASNVTYTTEVVTALTTYCPEATQISYNGQTYTISEATTLTITNCPCTVSKPVYTTSSVVCNTCPVATSSVPVYANSTVAAPTYPAGTAPAPVGTAPSSVSGSAPTGTPTPIANGAMALSGASLAGVLGLAAFLL